MSSENPPAAKSRGWVRLLIAFVVAFDVAAFFQWADGAFRSEFGGHPDEAANYLDGIRVRDAVTQQPIAALRYTSAFCIAQGGWMLAFGTSRIAVMLFMAAIAAATAALIFGMVRRESGNWAAVVVTMLWLCAPAVRESYETVLPELFAAFILTGAGLLWARIMEEGGLARRSAAVKWISVAGMVIGGGVLAFAIGVALKLLPGDPRSAWLFLRECAFVLGIAAAVFALAGVIFRRIADARTGTVWAAMIALVAGMLLSRWMKSGIPEVRVLIVATPALAMLAARGAFALAGIVGSQTAIAREHSRRKALWLLLLLLLALPPALLHPWAKDWQGFGPIAHTLIEESRGPARVLVVSDPRGEGILISEIAMRDAARQITIERGSETLTDPAVSAPRGRPLERFLEDEHLFTHLTSGSIRYIVLDGAVPEHTRAGYHDQILRIIEGNIRSFWPIYDSPIIRDGEEMGHPLRIFRVMQPEGVQLQ